MTNALMRAPDLYDNINDMRESVDVSLQGKSHDMNNMKNYDVKNHNVKMHNINSEFICRENSTLPEKLGRIGFIGRFEPLHIGGATVLETMCKRADYVIIGVGSANKYNYRNPYSADEREAMLNKFLGTKHNNYAIVKLQDYGHIPEYADGTKWIDQVKNYFGELDYFVTGNDYVKSLLKDVYNIIHPAELLYRDEQIPSRSTHVRILMTYSDEWKNYVPKEVSQYIVDNDLDKRFRKEFGLETLEKCLGKNISDDFETEKENVKIIN